MEVQVVDLAEMLLCSYRKLLLGNQADLPRRVGCCIVVVIIGTMCGVQKKYLESEIHSSNLDQDTDNGK